MNFQRFLGKILLHNNQKVSTIHLIGIMLIKFYDIKFLELNVSVIFLHTAVHCNRSQNGIDHQMCPEDMTSQLEEEEEFVDGGAVLLEDGGPSFRGVSPPTYHRRSPPQRSVSESELSRVRAPRSQFSPIKTAQSALEH